MKITKRLQDQYCLENNEAVFECELNKTNIPVEWLYNGEPISQAFESDTYIISNVDLKYTICIPSCKLKNQGIFTLVTPNQSLKTQALLNVDGYYLFFFFSNIFSFNEFIIYFGF